MPCYLPCQISYNTTSQAFAAHIWKAERFTLQPLLSKNKIKTLNCGSCKTDVCVSALSILSKVKQLWCYGESVEIKCNGKITKKCSIHEGWAAVRLSG